jgi:hypothetical protein
MSLKFSQLLCILALSTLSVFAGDKQKSLPEATAKGAFFRENKGQVKDQNWQPRPDVLFSGEANGLTYHLKKDGLHYQLSKVDTWKEESEMRKAPGMEKEAHKVPDQISMYRVDVRWLGANPFCEIITSEARPDYENFYNVPEGIEPALFVKSYASVTYKNLYENIDLKFYQTPDGELEYDFIVHSGGDYKKIQLDIQGATLSLNQKQELEITTPIGTITEGALRVHQEGKTINAGWVLNNETTVSYQIENFNSAADLIIDPPVRLWGTYYGGDFNDWGHFCTMDASGNVFLAGKAKSAIAIASSGAHQTTYGGAIWDAFLVKFDSSGIRLWGTYYGGNEDDNGTSGKTDASGNVYIAGFTASFTSIGTVGAHQSTLGNSNGIDAFLVKFNASGIRLWGTYYGGTGQEYDLSCTTDATNNVYLAGTTTSTSAIVTLGAHQATYGGGDCDAFLVKFDSSGSRLWGTYYGGNDYDYGGPCTVDASGNVFLAGSTMSLNAIATLGAHQTIHGGFSDAFLVKFDASGTRIWGTYYGGNSSDVWYSCTKDNSGNLYLGGCTTSTNAIATSGAYQTTIVNSSYLDAFLVKFDANGTCLWGTYYGGYGEDLGYSCSTDALNNVYFVGHTKNSTSIATTGSYQSTYGGGDYDAFLVKFEASGTRLWGTYYGGNDTDWGYSCTADPTGNVYLAGTTRSTTSIATSGAHQTSHGGFLDAFLVKFDGSGTSTGLELTKENTSPITLSPNPGQNQLTISGLPEGTIFDISILNTLGQVVYFSEHLYDSESVKINLPNGIYEVIVETKDARYTQKWVVSN